MHSICVGDCVLTTALVPSVPSLCFLVYSAKLAKVRETFWHLLILFVNGEILSEVVGWVGQAMDRLDFGLVQVRYASPGLFDSSLQLPGQEKHFGILFIPLRVDTVVCTDMPGEIMACLSLFSALFIVFCSWTFSSLYSSVTEEHLIPFVSTYDFWL